MDALHMHTQQSKGHFWIVCLLFWFCTEIPCGSLVPTRSKQCHLNPPSVDQKISVMPASCAALHCISALDTRAVQGTTSHSKQESQPNEALPMELFAANQPHWMNDALNGSLFDAQEQLSCEEAANLCGSKTIQTFKQAICVVQRLFKRSKVQKCTRCSCRKAALRTQNHTAAWCKNNWTSLVHLVWCEHNILHGWFPF